MNEADSNKLKVADSLTKLSSTKKADPNADAISKLTGAPGEASTTEVMGQDKYNTYLAQYRNHLIATGAYTEEEANRTMGMEQVLSEASAIRDRYNQEQETAHPDQMYDSSVQALSQSRSFLENLPDDFFSTPEGKQFYSFAGLDSSKAAYYRAKDLHHDVAYMEGNAQKAIVDWAKCLYYDRGNSKRLTKSEAEAMAKEAGVDIKFEENERSDTIRYKINQAVQKKELEEELAIITANQDFTGAQNLMLWASTVTGTVTAVDLAIMALTTWLGEAAVAAAVAGISSKALVAMETANTIAKAGRMGTKFNASQKAAIMARKIEKVNRVKLAAKSATVKVNVQKQLEALLGNEWNYFKTLPPSTKAEKNLQKLGRMLEGFNKWRTASVEAGSGVAVGIGKKAGAKNWLLTRSAATARWTVDGLISEIPVAILRELDQKKMEGDPVTVKELVEDILLAGGMAGGMRAAGAGIGLIGVGLGKGASGLIGKALEIQTKRMAKQLAEAKLKDNAAAIEQIESSGRTTSNALNDLRSIVDEAEGSNAVKADPNKKAGSSLVTEEEAAGTSTEGPEVVSIIEGDGVTDNEILSIFQTLKGICDGSLSPDALYNMEKIGIIGTATWWSSIKGMYKCCLNIAEKGGDWNDLLDEITKANIPLLYYSKIPKGNTPMEQLETAIHAIAKKEASNPLALLKCGVNIQGDKGALSRRFCYGINASDAVKFSMAMRLYHYGKLMGNEAGEAMVRKSEIVMQEHQQNLAQIYNYAKHVETVYNKYVNLNREVSDARDAWEKATKEQKDLGKIQTKLQREKEALEKAGNVDSTKLDTINEKIAVNKKKMQDQDTVIKELKNVYDKVRDEKEVAYVAQNHLFKRPQAFVKMTKRGDTWLSPEDADSGFDNILEEGASELTVKKGMQRVYDGQDGFAAWDPSQGYGISLTEAYEELAVLILPSEERAAYAEALAWLRENSGKELIRKKGETTEFLKIQAEKQAIIDKVNRYKRDFCSEFLETKIRTVTLKNGTKVELAFINPKSLNPKETVVDGVAKVGTIDNTWFLRNFARNIGEGEDSMFVQNDFMMRNTDLANANPEEVPAKMAELLKKGTLLGDAGSEMPVRPLDLIGYNSGGADLSAATVRQKLYKKGASADRLSTTKNAVFKTLSEQATDTTDRIFNSSVASEAQGRLHKAWFISIIDMIKGCETIQNLHVSEFADGLATKLRALPYFKTAATLDYVNMSPEALNAVLQSQGRIFGETIKSHIKSILPSELSTGFFSSRLDDILDDIANQFQEVVEKDPHRFYELMTKEPTTYTEGMTQDMLEASLKQDMEASAKLDELLDPVLSNLAEATADYEAALLQTQEKILSFMEEALKNPGKAMELLLGKVTWTYAIQDGASLSVEALSDITTELAHFLRKLKTSEHNLMEYAYDDDNIEAIREAIADRIAKETGLISDNEFRATAHYNDSAGEVAKHHVDLLMGEMADRCWSVGGARLNFAKLFDSHKIRNAGKYLSKEDMQSSELVKSVDWLKAEASKEVIDFKKEVVYSIFGARNEMLNASKREGASLTGVWDSVFHPGKKREYEIKQRAGLHFIEVLDLDKTIRMKGHNPKYSYNAVRDAILSRDDKAVQEVISNYGEEEVKKAIREIGDFFYGNHEKRMLGFVDNLANDGRSVAAEKASRMSRYIEQGREFLQYKSLGAQKADLKIFGHTNYETWIKQDLGHAKKTYALLKNLGVDPYQTADAMYEMLYIYAHDPSLAAIDHGLENAEKMRRTLGGRSKASLDYAVKMMTGEYSMPASTGVRIANLITQILSSRMLMHAGLKSFTDYGIQSEQLVTMGLMSSTDIMQQADVIRKCAHAAFHDKELALILGLQQTNMMDILARNFYNSPLGLAAPEAATGDWFHNLAQSLGDLAKSFKESPSGMNELASWLDRAEESNRLYQTILMRNLSMVEPLTEANRTNAALSVCRSIAKFHEDGGFSGMKDAVQERNLRQTLTRHAITDWEWDNIYSKYGIVNVKDYAQRTNPWLSAEERAKLDKYDFNMFEPEALYDISNSDIAKLLKAQGKTKVTDTEIQQYKNYIIDRASALVNASANEMTSLPTARVQGALTLNLDPNTGYGMVAKIGTQFQSFGLATTFYTHGRRVASFMDWGKAPLFDNILLSAMGYPQVATSMLGMLSHMAVMQYIINEGIAFATGNYKTYHNEDGTFAWDRVSDKVVQAYIDQTGIAKPVLDSIYSTLCGAMGKGGGLSLSIAPAISGAVSDGKKIIAAATRESTKGARLPAVAGALGSIGLTYTGIPTTPYFQAFYGATIGDYLQQLQYGELGYYEQVRKRTRNGYAPSWARELMDLCEEYFTRH